MSDDENSEFIEAMFDLPDRNKRWYDKHGKEYARKYHKNNRELVNRINNNYYQRNKDKIRKMVKENRLKKLQENPEAVKLEQWKNHIKYTYGLTIERYNEMKEEQQYKCKICKKEVKLHIDHCHTTKKVRGLLCIKCNSGLGWYENYTKEMYEYLK